MKIIDRMAFSSVFNCEYPRHMNKENISICPNDPDSDQNVADFIGVNWMDIDSIFWYGREDAIFYFSASACCYYVPSIIASTYEDWAGMNLVFSALINQWTPNENDEYKGVRPRRGSIIASNIYTSTRDQRWNDLSMIQRGFIIGWLIGYCRIKCDNDMIKKIDKSVEFLKMNPRANQ